MNSKRILKYAISIIVPAAVVAGIFFFGQKPPARTNDEYQALEDRFARLAEETNPRQSLAAMRVEMPSNVLLAENCHSITHRVGREAFAKFNGFAEALVYNDPICTGGFMHGAVEARLDDSPNVVEDVQKICKDYKEGTFLGWQCYHGLGHGAMYYTGNNLPQSLDICDNLTTVFALNQCYQGVMMENFGIDGKIHTSKYLDPKDPPSVCRNLDSPAKQYVCFGFLPYYYLSLNPGQYAETLARCLEFPGYSNACALGVGAVFVDQNLESPEKIQPLCASQDDLADWCIDGAVTVLWSHYADLSRAEQFCLQVEERFKTICNRTVDGNRGMFSQPQS